MANNAKKLSIDAIDERKFDCESKDYTLSELTPLIDKEKSEYLSEIEAISKLPKWRHIGYAVAALGNSTASSFIGVYFTIFLLDVAQIEAKYVSLIVLIGKMLNAFSDPLVGYLVSQSPDTKIGKFKPWILVALPFYILLNVLMWLVPHAFSETSKVIYYLVVYCANNIFGACYIIPYMSSVLSMTSCQQERDSLVATRVICMTFGQIMSMTIYAVYQYAGTQLGWHSEMAYFIAAVTNASIMTVLGAVMFFSIEERYTLDHGRGKWGPIFAPYFQLLKFKPYLILMFNLCFAHLAYNVAISIYALFYKYVLNAENLFPLCAMITTISAGLSVFLWKLVMKYSGKKLPVTVGYLLLIVLCWMHLFFEYNFILLMVVATLFGVLTSCCIQFIPATMVPDVIGAYSLKHGHGNEAMFYSITFFIETMSLALCSSLSTAALEAVGYTPGNDSQPPGVALTLRLIFGIFPVICLLAALIFLWEYPITEMHRKNMQHAIKKSMDHLCKKSNQQQQQQQLT